MTLPTPNLKDTDVKKKKRKNETKTAEHRNILDLFTHYSKKGTRWDTYFNQNNILFMEIVLDDG